MTVPLRCVSDTNVTTTANRANGGASEACVVASAKALQAVMANGHVFIDAGGHIVAEYRKHLSPKSQPGPGDAFFKWLLTHEWSSKRVTRVVITPTPEDEEDFVDLPAPPRGTVYDRERDEFWSVSRRDVLADKLRLAVVPRVGTGRFDVSRLISLLGTSRLADSPAEGLYVRRDEGDHLVTRAKLVRREFVQAMDEQHWSKKQLRPNALAAGARGVNALH